VFDQVDSEGRDYHLKDHRQLRALTIVLGSCVGKADVESACSRIKSVKSPFVINMFQMAAPIAVHLGTFA
jgi:hypothetical protein